MRYAKYIEVIVACFAFAVLTIGCSDPPQELPGTQKITLAQLEEMFAATRSDTDWDMDSEMLWGYFFTSGYQERLQTAKEGPRLLEYVLPCRSVFLSCRACFPTSSSSISSEISPATDFMDSYSGQTFPS